jgi:amino acid transporter
MGEAKGVYVRAASGLLREMGPGSAFLYNFVTLSLFSTSQQLLYGPALYLYPGVEIGVSVITGAIVMVFLYASYAILASAMPRSGGDYVFQSRILHPALGFASTFPMWVFWQFLYLGWYGWQVATMGVAPFLAIAGVQTHQPNLLGMASWVMSPDGNMAMGIIVLVIGVILCYKGMRFYVKALTGLFILLLSSGLILLILPLTISREQFAVNFNTFMANFAPDIPDFYHYVVQQAQQAGVALSPQFSWRSTAVSWSYAWFIFPYAIWSINNMGEIKRADSFKFVFLQCFPALILTSVFWAALWYVLKGTMGLDFLTAIGYVAWEYPAGLIEYFPITPFYTLLAGLSTSNLALLFWALVVGTFANCIGVTTTIMMGTTRTLFAMTFDRLLPEKLAYIHPKSRSPLVALIVLFIGGLIFGYFINYRYDIIGPYFASVTVAMVPTLFLGSLAAAIFPYRAKTIFDRAPVSRYKVGGLPLSVICGIGGMIICVVMAFFFFTEPKLGFLGVVPQAVVWGIFIASGIYYYLIRWYRSRQGIEMELAFREVPPE